MSPDEFQQSLADALEKVTLAYEDGYGMLSTIPLRTLALAYPYLDGVRKDAVRREILQRQTL